MNWGFYLMANVRASRKNRAMIHFLLFLRLLLFFALMIVPPSLLVGRWVHGER